MEDITNQLHDYLIQTELDKLKSDTGYTYEHIRGGKFRRVVEQERVRLDIAYGIQTVRPEAAVRVTDGSDRPVVNAQTVNTAEESTWENLNADQERIKKKAKAKVRSDLNEDLKRKIDI
jgi:septin family protein